MRQPIFSLLLNILALLILDRLLLQSPVEPTVEVVPNETEPLAKRVVLIVADGLRYDTAFSGWTSNEDNSEEDVLMPYLKAKLEDDPKCTCGTSFSQAPTESRACHTAMLAGFWEDTANLKENWKKPYNPDFDHVLRRANFSLAIGGPDVVEFFPGPNVEIHSFPFSDYKNVANTEDLDLWTVERFEQILKDKVLDDPGNVYFLHLAGVDTAGHRHGPHSTFYRTNAHYVDGLIKRIEDAVRERFGDDQTAFIFTSDHGFADEGGHGTGDYNSVKCPLVLWGSTKFLGHQRNSCESNTIRQSSIHAIISMLLGIPYATNSFYGLPTNILSFRDDSDALARMEPNIKQLYTHLKAKQDRNKSRSLLFYALSHFRSVKTSGIDDVTEMVECIKKLEKELASVDNVIPMLIKLLSAATAIALVVLSDADTELTISPMALVLCAVIGFFVELNVIVILLVTTCFLVLVSAVKVPRDNLHLKSILIVIITIALMALGMINCTTCFLLALALNFVSPVAKYISSDSWTRNEVFLKGLSALVAIYFPSDVSIPLVIAIEAMNLYKRRYIGHFLTLMNLVMCLVSPFKLYTPISLIIIVGHIAVIFWIQPSEICFESLGLHILCLVSRGRHLGIFPLLATLASLGFDSSVSDLPSNTKPSQGIKTSIISIRILLLVFALVFLPIGLHVNDDIAMSEYRRTFGLDCGTVLGITKVITALFIICSIERQALRGRVENIFSMTLAFGLGVASILAFTLSPVGSWLEIGTSIARYIVALTTPIAILLILLLHTTLHDATKYLKKIPL